MSTGITKWLEGLGLGEYAELFVEQRIDEDVIPELTDTDLRVLDIPLGPRKKLLKAEEMLQCNERLFPAKGLNRLRGRGRAG